MQIEQLPGATNVVRFPSERLRRPTLDLLREIAPDVRSMPALAEALGAEPPDPDLRDEADMRMAEWIVTQVPPSGPERAAMLAQCRAEVIATAIKACRAAQDARSRFIAANQAFDRAQKAGGYWMTPLHDRLIAAQEQHGLLVLAAHARTEEAEGAVRAIELAGSGQPWIRFSAREATDWLIATQASAR